MRVKLLLLLALVALVFAVTPAGPSFVVGEDTVAAYAADLEVTEFATDTAPVAIVAFQFTNDTKRPTGSSVYFTVQAWTDKRIVLRRAKPEPIRFDYQVHLRL